MPGIWKGSISFGLVNIPVELTAAVRADHIAFRLLDAKTKAPVKYERVRSTDGKALKWEEIVKGYEYTKGNFIILTDEDFKSAAIESSKSIEILDFVTAADIDPRFFETPYFLMPSKGGEKSYALLREAMRDEDVVGIGKIIMRQHQHLAGIHVVGEALVLEIMRFANEVVDVNNYNFPKSSSVSPKERAIAKQLVNTLSGEFEPEKYTDDYRSNLLRIIKAKSKGKHLTLEAPEREAPDAKVLDLMEKLQKSLGSSRKATSSAKKPKKAVSRSAVKTVAKSVAKSVTKSASKRPRRKSA